MQRFRISPGSEKEGLVTLDKNESHHALSVLRLKAGEVVELLDGQGGVFQGIVASADKSGVKISVGARRTETESPVKITLAASVIKPEAMELLIQKACELGAHSVVPLISERTVVRLSRERWQSKGERWQKIAQESCKQCGQSRVPVVQPVAEFSRFIQTASEYELSLIPTLTGPVERLGSTLNTHRSAKSVLVLIGPEGDFSKSEVVLAVERGVKPVNLGPLVLRSETAALYVLSALEFYYREVALEKKKGAI